MRYIQKQIPEPPTLTYFLKWVTENADRLSKLSGADQWRDFGRKEMLCHKHSLQNTLIDEQGHICAYCNRRIHIGGDTDDEQFRIEHLQPKTGKPDPETITFNYYNLVACCFGDEREGNREYPPRSIHCDVSKGDTPIPAGVSPTNVDCEKTLIYTAEGEIISTDSIVLKAIKETLNLNCEKLTRLRKKVLSPFIDLDPDLDSGEVDKQIELYTKPSQNKLEPFCGVIIGYLRQNYHTTL